MVQLNNNNKYNLSPQVNNVIFLNFLLLSLLVLFLLLSVEISSAFIIIPNTSSPPPQPPNRSCCWRKKLPLLCRRDYYHHHHHHPIQGRSSFSSILLSLSSSTKTGEDDDGVDDNNDEKIISKQQQQQPLKKNNLNIAIVGAGPSGSLLAHLLLQNNNINNSNNNNNNIRVTLLESRSDPRQKTMNNNNNDDDDDTNTTNTTTTQKIDQGRAYALGIGIRGRTAIRQVNNNNKVNDINNNDEEGGKEKRKSSSSSSSSSSLWESIRSNGYESERFQLHLPFFGGLIIPLRSEDDNHNHSNKIEPSLLIYQSQLCSTLINELEEKKEKNHNNNNNNNLQILFDTKVEKCNIDEMTISTTTTTSKTTTKTTTTTTTDNIMGPFDIIVGCDGVNSIVRETMIQVYPEFQSTVQRLPGDFKVVQLDKVPPNVDPTAVSLIFPKTSTSGSCSAFVEPTSSNGDCCILFAGGSRVGSTKTSSPIISETSNITTIIESLQQGFPQWDDNDDNDDDDGFCYYYEEIAKQLMSRKNPGSASSVQCNTYHYRDKLVLVGDAAHATGGVSGQGVNSALMDSAVLASCILNEYTNDDGDGDDDGDGSIIGSRMDKALLSYSQKQVPEGKALYDLSFGPKPKGIIKKISYAFQNLKDTLFRGKFGIGQQPLQTVLTTSLIPFAQLRRERDQWYHNPNGDDDEPPFPSQTEFDEQLKRLHQLSMEDDNDNK